MKQESYRSVYVTRWRKGRKEKVGKDVHADVVITLQSTCCVGDGIELNSNVGELFRIVAE